MRLLTSLYVRTFENTEVQKSAREFSHGLDGGSISDNNEASTQRLFSH
jgi:hypothetical protein